MFSFFDFRVLVQCLLNNGYAKRDFEGKGDRVAEIELYI
jgi:hypothetical protein